MLRGILIPPGSVLDRCKLAVLFSLLLKTHSQQFAPHDCLAFPATHWSSSVEAVCTKPSLLWLITAEELNN